MNISRISSMEQCMIDTWKEDKHYRWEYRAPFFHTLRSLVVWLWSKSYRPKRRITPWLVVSPPLLPSFRFTEINKPPQPCILHVNPSGFNWPLIASILTISSLVNAETPRSRFIHSSPTLHRRASMFLDLIPAGANSTSNKLGRKLSRYFSMNSLDARERFVASLVDKCSPYGGTKVSKAREHLKVPFDNLTLSNLKLLYISCAYSVGAIFFWSFLHFDLQSVVFGCFFSQLVVTITNNPTGWTFLNVKKHPMKDTTSIA